MVTVSDLDEDRQYVYVWHNLSILYCETHRETPAICPEKSLHRFFPSLRFCFIHLWRANVLPCLHHCMLIFHSKCSRIKFSETERKSPC